MRKYETLVLFSPEMSGENRTAIVENLTGVITREEGQILTLDDWGMRNLAYPVQKQMRGYFIRFEYVAPGKAVAEVERIIRITDGIFKFVTVLLDAAYEAAEEVA
ncbi:MAG: 30S ribosomal protein S6 [Desulfovibrionaceae bacterium]